jgi:xanthine dehydrogenase YagS FAD-binding subunit
VKSAKIVMGHVAPMPIDSAAAARALVGKSVSAANAEAAGKAAVANAKPLSQNAYKVNLARVAIKRALLDAVKVAKA